MNTYAIVRGAGRRMLLPADARPLALLRIGVAAVLLVKVIAEWGAVPALYGEHGPLPWSISHSAAMPGAPSLVSAAMLLHHVGISADATPYAVMGLYAFALTLLMLGWMTRAAALIACYAHWMLNVTGSLSTYGVDMFASILLFYCVVAPVGAVMSLDARGREPSPPSVSNRVYVLLLQAHLCIIYVTAGIAKSHGADWWSGDAIWKALMQPQFNHGIDWSWLPWVPGFALTLSLMTLLLETGYAAAVFVPRLRTVWLASIVGMHAGIALFMDLRLFAAIMIVFNLAAFAHEIEADTRHWSASLWNRAPWLSSGRSQPAS